MASMTLVNVHETLVKTKRIYFEKRPVIFAGAWTQARLTKQEDAYERS